MVARRIPDPKVAGSIPVIFSLVCGASGPPFLRWGHAWGRGAVYGSLGQF